MSEKSDSREEIRRELSEALEKMRREVEKVRKDLTTATRTWMETTRKIVQQATPKVSSTIDQALEQTSEGFRKTMASLGKETKQFQASFLRSYRIVLAKQMEFIEKKLKELTK